MRNALPTSRRPPPLHQTQPATALSSLWTVASVWWYHTIPYHTTAYHLLLLRCHMTTINLVGLFFLPLLTVTPTTAQECRADNLLEDGSCRPPQPDCSVFMAPSTLGDYTNMGFYTAKDVKEGEILNYPEIVVPLLFREWGEHPEGYSDGVLWDRYIWEGSVVNLETYVETDLEMSRAGFIPGIGCTVNSIMDGHNIISTHGSKYDTVGLHRAKDPGAGAFTPYHHSLTEASEDIPAGSELFAEYGDQWIVDIPGAQITLNEQMDEADDFMEEQYLPFIEKHKKQLTAEMKQALWEFTTKDFPVYDQAMTNLPRYPWSEVEAFVEKELKKRDKNDQVSLVRHFIRKQSIRSVEWLNEWGYCQDHIKPAPSTIPQAGRGAFATRDLPAGTVVGYAPLVHIGYYGREIFVIDYEDTPGADGDREMYDMMINYSFGHRNSSVILTPYGGMVNYINHGSGDKANVKVRWPDRNLVAHKPEWLKQDINYLRDTIEKIGLSFEYVALRDIQEGEEVLMDYGPEWEAAWNDHVTNWKPLRGAENYVYSGDWPEDHLRTMNELQTNPYPENLHTMCIESYARDDETGGFEFVPIYRETTFRRHCDVMARRPDSDGGYLYDVNIQLDEDDEESWITVKNYDATGVKLYDLPFSTDWHMPNTFRHEMAIPDDIMPPTWQNGPPPDPFED